MPSGLSLCSSARPCGAGWKKRLPPPSQQGVPSPLLHQKAPLQVSPAPGPRVEQAHETHSYPSPAETTDTYRSLALGISIPNSLMRSLMLNLRRLSTAGREERDGGEEVSGAGEAPCPTAPTGHAAAPSGAGSHCRAPTRPSGVGGLRIRNLRGRPFGTLLPSIAPADLTFPQC